jgi:hypothetical protein
MATLPSNPPAKFFQALRPPLAPLGQCMATQTREGQQFRADAEMGLHGPLVARIHIPPPPNLTTVIILDGQTFVQGGQSSDNLWHETKMGPLNRVIGEMDCRTVLSDMEKATQSITVAGPTTLDGLPAQKYELTYDVAGWTSGHGEPKPSDNGSGTMTVWVRDGKLAQMETDIDGSRVTSYKWFPGRPDVAAPPADQVAR